MREQEGQVAGAEQIREGDGEGLLGVAKGGVGANRSKKKDFPRRALWGLILSCWRNMSLRMQRGALPRRRG